MVNLLPLAITRPVRVVQLPYWPERTADVITAAVAGATGPVPLALGIDFPDGTSMCLEYQTTKRLDVPTPVYEVVGPPPLLSIIVIDNGVGVDAAGHFVHEHDAERALREIAILLGANNPKAVYGESVNPRKTRRQYWWRLSA